MSGSALFVLPRSPRGVRIGRDLMGGYGMEVGRRLVYPPMQSVWLATLLRERGYDVAVHEEDWDGDAPSVDSGGRPWELVFVHVAQPSWTTDVEVGSRLSWTCQVIFHGSLVRELPELCLSAVPAAWAIVREEEAVVAAFPRAVERTLGTLPPGCAVLGSSGLTIGEEPPVLPLDRLPIPDRSLLVLGRHRLPDRPGPLATTFHSRGCPFDCSFCGYVYMQGTAMRFRRPVDVARELEDVARRGYRRVVFRDAIFSVNRQRTLALLAALREADTGLPWQCETAPRCLDEELLEAMRAAGCEHVSLGIETEAPDVQREHCGDKLPEREKVVRVLRTARRLGITTRGFFMMGFPGEDRAALRRTARQARSLRFDSVQFCAVTEYPGTSLAGEGRSNVPLADGRRFAGSGNGVLSAKEIDREIRRAYRLHYLHPANWLPLLAHPGVAWSRFARYLTLTRGR